MRNSIICGPKIKDHPSIGKKCPLCEKPFVEGCYTTLRAICPASAEDWDKKAEGRPYTAECKEIHYDCINPLVDPRPYVEKDGQLVPLTSYRESYDSDPNL